MADKNGLFREVMLQICGSLSMAKAMHRCLPLIGQVIPVDRMGVFVNDRGLSAVRTILLADHAKCWEPNIFTPLPAEFWKKLEKRKPSELLVITRSELDPVTVRITNHPAFDPLAKQTPSQGSGSCDVSLLSMRLETEGKWLGSLALAVDGQGRYTEEHARLLAPLHEPFVIALANTLQHQEILRLKEILADDNKYLRAELSRKIGEKIVGAQFGLREVMEQVDRIASLSTPVFLTGETGTGKEVIANAIHNLSRRSNGPLIKVNCGAIPDSLIDSELFGHEKGAFTGAIVQKRGWFERAQGGTIFLDEVGELPAAAQIRFLRVIQEQEMERVGGSRTIGLDVRIISATHRNLKKLCQSKIFREDLYYRLSVFPIYIPPLREHKEDIPALTDYFLQKKSKELKLTTSPVLNGGAIDQLVSYDWPGNVRELENVVERALILSRGGSPLRFDWFFLPAQHEQTDVRTPSTQKHGHRSLNEVISDHIQDTLVQTKNKIHGPGGAAELLRINPNTLRSKMKKLGIVYKQP